MSRPISRSFRSIIILCVVACGMANAWPNLLRGRQARSGSDVGLPRHSALLNRISEKIESLLSKLNTIPHEDGDEEWIEFYDEDDPIGNYTFNATSVTEYIGNYSIQTNTSIVIMQLSNGSHALIMTEEFKDADADNECGDDSDCGENRFCRNGLFYGTECRDCGGEDALCSRHTQCCNNAVCYLGRCTGDAIEGEVGAACANADDCSEDMCCAAMTGSILRVCKPFARIGEDCDTGVQRWLSTLLQMYPPTDCPCENPLTCQDIGYFVSDNVCVPGDRRIEHEANDDNDVIDVDTDALRFNPMN